MKKYRVRIENSQGQTIMIRGFTLPYYELSYYPWPDSAGGSSYIELHNNYWTNFRAELSNSVTLFAYPTYPLLDAYTQVFVPFGMTNVIGLDNSFTGHKFIFNNKSYIEIVSCVMSGGTTDVTLNYCLENGTVAYRNVHFVLNSDRVMYFYAFPWYSGMDNYQLFMTSFSNGYDFNYMSCSLSTHNPETVDLGRQFFDGLDPLDEDDPYPDDDSDDDYPDGPDGIPDPDPIPVPPDPDINILDSGFITLYTPTLSQVRNLAHYMWSGLFDLNTFKKIFADPMDCILGFNILPMTVPHSGSGAVMVGNISTSVTMNLVSKQWVTVDCGTLNIGAIYDTYLDYAPYTKWSIYLPFIGLQQLSADDVAHRSLHLVYRVDVLSCACVAYLKSGDQVLYQYSGSCGYSIPLTSNNFASMISNIVGIATTAGSLIASGGATAPMALGASASIVNNVMGLKPDIKRSGSIGASAGLMGIQTPYIILEVPNICKPSKQHHYLGYPSFITKTVSDVSGYVEFESIVLSGVTCTDAEREQIEQILKGGCYV